MEPERREASWMPAPPNPPRESSGISAALDQFVLNDGTKARLRIESAGRSMLVMFIDPDGNPLPGSPVELHEDFTTSVGSTTIVGHWAPARGLAIAENARHVGLLRVFVAYGSSSVRFFQYARSDVCLDLRSGGDVVSEGTRWRLDTGFPYSGTFTSEEMQATGMFDGPGTSPEFDPFEAVRHMAGGDEGDPADELPPDATFTLTHEFETLPYVEGDLLGSITWSYTLTWTLADGPSTAPVVSATAPVWRPPENTQSQMPDSLGTSWNPRVTHSRHRRNVRTEDVHIAGER
jgi:hypothetical protein